MRGNDETLWGTCHVCGRRFDLERDNVEYAEIHDPASGLSHSAVRCAFCISPDQASHIDPREWYGSDWIARWRAEGATWVGRWSLEDGIWWYRPVAEGVPDAR